MQMNTSEIMEIIPHRPPFLLVDRIIEMDEENQRAVGIKNITMNEPQFQGHFGQTDYARRADGRSARAGGRGYDT